MIKKLSQTAAIFACTNIVFGAAGPSALALGLRDEPFWVMNSGPKMRHYFKEIEARAYKNITDYNLPKLGVTSTAFSITADGKIKDFSIGPSSGNPSADFACAEAIISSSPLPEPPKENYIGHPPKSAINLDKRTQIDFYQTNYPKYFQLPISYSNTAAPFFDGNESRRNQEVALHLIPLDVVQRYPGLFTTAELSARDNCVGIPIAGLFDEMAGNSAHKVIANTTVKKFFASWEEFFASHKAASKEEILHWKKKVAEELSENLKND